MTTYTLLAPTRSLALLRKYIIRALVNALVCAPASATARSCGHLIGSVYRCIRTHGWVHRCEHDCSIGTQFAVVLTPLSFFSPANSIRVSDKAYKSQVACSVLSCSGVTQIRMFHRCSRHRPHLRSGKFTHLRSALQFTHLRSEVTHPRSEVTHPSSEVSHLRSGDDSLGH